jgi:hypothetical protein
MQKLGFFIIKGPPSLNSRGVRAFASSLGNRAIVGRSR